MKDFLLKRNTGKKGNNHDSVLTHAKEINVDALRTDGTCKAALPTTHTIARTRGCSGLSVSGVAFVSFSFEPLSRADGAMRNKTA